jgi:hypothetical protein
MRGEPRISRDSVKFAIERLQMLAYYSKDLNRPLADLLERMCPSEEALEWLVNQMVNKVGVWRGPTELRGVLCSKYNPLDRIDAWCVDTPGFSAEEGEARYFKALPSVDERGPLPPEFRRLLRDASKKKEL